MTSTVRRALLLLLAAAGPAAAHDWYPPECCSGQDCAPAALCRLEGGREGVLALGRCLPIPPDARVSPDGGVHVCAGVNLVPGGEPVVLRCVFLPAGV